MVAITNNQINDYLYYGYLFPKKIPDWIFDLNINSDANYKYSIIEAESLFDSIMDEALDQLKFNKYCIVPISGGWDSRILLAATVDRLDSSQIKSYSFGAPGQLDYEIGYKVARSLGVEHHAIDLRKIEIEWDQLKETVTEAPWTKVFDSFFNRFCVRNVAASGDLLLSGFMGDPLTGSHFSETSDRSVIVKQFVKKQNLANNLDLVEKNYDPVASIPDLSKKFSFDTGELLDYGIRQANMIAPIVTPLPEMNNWGYQLGSFRGSESNIIAPFAHPSWASYWISAPKLYKKDRKLFFSMFQKKFPQLYKIPAKEYYGAIKNHGFERNLRRNIFFVRNRLHKYFPKVLNQSNIMMNYLDFDWAFRYREDYQKIMSKAFTFLQENSIAEWIKIDMLINSHMKFEANYAKSINVLIGLALNIKVNNQSK